MTAPTATPLRSMLSENATGFMPSSVSAREQRAREKTDRTIKQFIEKFIEKGFFPLGSEPLIFCLLPQLTEWPSDVQLKVVNENGDTIATYLKGSDPSVIKHSVSVVQDRSGEYATSSDDGDEELLPLIISQLPAGSQLGVGGDFPNSSSPDGRIVTLRKQLVDLLKSERAAVFEALLWDDGAMKCDPYFSHRNRFLPLWLQQVHEHSPVLKVLLALSPSVPAERLNALLDRFPLSEAEEQDFLDKDVLPASFIKALNHSVEEWRNDRALDGIFHKRTYNEDADALTRTCAQRILKSLLGYQLLIAEVDQEGKYVIDPEPSTASIVLLHSGNGYYAAKNLGNDEVYRFSGGTDTFYLAIASVLQPHERLSLGMHSDTDVDGLRLMLGNVAAAASGGWYDPQQPLQVKEASLPDWMKQASTADKLIWNNATQNYRQALIEAQAPALLSLSEYGDADQLRVYAKNLLRDRLEFDLGLRLDPDDITVEITNSEWIPYQGPVGLGPGGAVLPVVGGGLNITPTRCSLPQLCLQNISLFDLNFLLTASFVDKSEIPIKELSSRYVHSLVRELNVGDSYTAFLKQRLLTSFHGQWSRDQYARVMDAQMRLDAIEAKMAMYFLVDGSLPPELADRGYKWVMAVLDRAVDGEASARVEGHRIRVQEVKLTDSTPTNLHYYGPPGVYSPGQFDGLTLQGVLIIAPASRQSIPSVVVYTPSAPDSVSFREYASEQEMLEKLFANSLLADYLISRLPVEPKTALGEVFGTLISEGHLKVTPSRVIAENVYFASYEAEVQRIIDQVDAQTTSTSEVNWQTAWTIASSLAELAIEFTPFKVRLPIAAARSIYAVSRGVRAVGEGNSSAAVHFVQAALLLTDGLPGSKKPKANRTRFGGLTPATVLSDKPGGLKLRTDGVYSGVYEKANISGPSSFYGQRAGKTFPIRYDADNATWRVIDPRRPDAYYQMPIRIDEQGNWNYNNIGLSGGGPGKGAKKAAKAAKASNVSDAPAAASSVNVSSVGKKNFTIEMGDFLDSHAFKDAQKRLPNDDLAAAINTAVERYLLNGEGKLHPSAGGLYTLDLPGIGQSTGRGNWRLWFDRPTLNPKNPKSKRSMQLIFNKVDTH